MMHFDTEAKASFVIFLWTCAFTLSWTIQFLVIIVLIVFEMSAKPFRPFSHTSHRSFVRFCFYAAVLALMTIFLNGLFIRTGTSYRLLGFIELHGDGLLFGTTVSARLMLMSLSVLLFFISTPLREFAQFLDRHGIHEIIVFVLLLSLYFIGQIPDRINRILTAQEARGAQIRAGIVSRTRAFFSILSPLVLSTIVQSIDRSIALEMRGFHQHPSKTAHHPFSASPLMYIFIFLSILILFGRFAEWLLN